MERDCGELQKWEIENQWKREREREREMKRERG